MVRLVASGPDEGDEQLAQLARAVLAETVVRRGTQPFPPRDVLPIVLPPVLAEQVVAAQQQMADEQGEGMRSEPLSAAPTPVSPQVEEDVVPGGAVAQSAQATVFTEDAPSAAPQPEAVVDHEEPQDPEPVTPPSASRGSALSRLRGRRRR
jgi:hypothetical protein